VSGLIRQGHFLGAKLRAVRKRHGFTLDELSARCVHRDASHAPSVSYLSMVETGKRMPSQSTLAVLADVLGKEPRWFLDDSPDTPLATGAVGDDPAVTAIDAMPLEPAFLFQRELLQHALPELLAQTGTSGRQFAQLLIRVWQETRQNDFPDIERAAESAGGRQLPLGLDAAMRIAASHGLTIRWLDEGRRRTSPTTPLRARFEAPATILVNERLRNQESRLKYELAYFIGHKILHNGDGLIPQRSATGLDDRLGDAPGAALGAGPGPATGMDSRDVLLAWRDFECSVFAGALLCPRAPFRQLLVREAHRIDCHRRLGVSAAVVMRRMTAVSPYRHWHFFDGYAPGILKAVYRGNGIPLPWGNLSLLPDPCPRWAVFRLLQDPTPVAAAPAAPTSQLSVMAGPRGPRLYACHSLKSRDAADVAHVLSVGIDLGPALAAQGSDASAIAAQVDAACRATKGSAILPADAAEAIRRVAHVLNIAWVFDALKLPASLICPRSGSCPRTPACGGRTLGKVGPKT
jgi:transcriptional regulator with XRE-family HTH domain